MSWLICPKKEECIIEDGSLKWVTVSLESDSSGNWLMLDCNEIVALLGRDAHFDIKGDHLAASLANPSSFFAVPMIPIFSDGRLLDVLITIENVESAFVSGFFGGSEKWKVDGALVGIPTANGNHLKPVIRFYIIRHCGGEPNHRPSFIGNDEKQAALGMAEKIMALFHAGRSGMIRSGHYVRLDTMKQKEVYDI